MPHSICQNSPLRRVYDFKGQEWAIRKRWAAEGFSSVNCSTKDCNWNAARSRVLLPFNWTINKNTKKTLFGIGILAVLFALSWKNTLMSPLKQYRIVALWGMLDHTLSGGSLVPCKRWTIFNCKKAQVRWCSARQRNQRPQLKVSQFTVNNGPSPASSKAWSCLERIAHLFSTVSSIPPIFWEGWNTCILQEMHPSVFLSTRCANAFTYVLLKWPPKKQKWEINIFRKIPIRLNNRKCHLQTSKRTHRLSDFF